MPAILSPLRFSRFTVSWCICCTVTFAHLLSTRLYQNKLILTTFYFYCPVPAFYWCIKTSDHFLIRQLIITNTWKISLVTGLFFILILLQIMEKTLPSCLTDGQNVKHVWDTEFRIFFLNSVWNGTKQTAEGNREYRALPMSWHNGCVVSPSFSNFHSSEWICLLISLTSILACSGNFESV